MDKEPLWIIDDVVIAIHRRQLAEHGGIDGIRDQTLLESSLARPKNLFHYGTPTPDFSAIAASYAYGIACNHPFFDGNKRTAFVVLNLFLKLNGFYLLASHEDKYQRIIKLASSELSEECLSQWIRGHINKSSP